MYDDYDDVKKPVLSHSAKQFADRVEEQKHLVKIFDTPKGLCMSCYCSLVYRSPKLKNGEWQMYCTNPNGPPMIVPDDISFCNQYSKKGDQSLRDMEKVATLIEKRDAKRVGFTSEVNDEDDEN
jgi:hypothetical protein